MKLEQHFQNKFPLSKTLRFELRPQGRTLEHIEKSGMLKKDEERAESYKKVKSIIDEYHKFFIDKALNHIELNDLSAFSALYYKANLAEDDKKQMAALQESMRKSIAAKFSKSDDETIKLMFNRLFAKELIREDLVQWASEEDCAFIREFRDFTTYFTGFHDNRKNMYSAEAISTAIAFRLIHENLPKFLDNLRVFEKAKQVGLSFEEVELNLEEVLQGKPIEAVFSLENYTNTLRQNDIDFYNTIVGGRTEIDGKKIRGVNETINLWNQQQKEKQNMVPKMKPLYKQILSDRESSSFRLDEFESDQEVLETINSFYFRQLRAYENDGNTEDVFVSIQRLLQYAIQLDPKGIYIKGDTNLTSLSNAIFGDWSAIPGALNEYYDRLFPVKGKVTQKHEDQRKKWLKQDFNVYTIEQALQFCELELVREKYKPGIVLNHFSKLDTNENGKNLIERIDHHFEQVKDLLNSEYDSSKNLAKDKENVDLIKALLDSMMDFIHFIKPLDAAPDGSEKDDYFYGPFTIYYDQLQQLIPIYNKVRNYLTRKPYSTEKVKINFEKATLLSGWDKNKESENLAIIFRRNGLYYLGIMDKKHNKSFKKMPFAQQTDKDYEKMVYKQIASPGNDLPNLIEIDGKVVMKKGRRNEDGVNKIREQALENFLPKEINAIRKNSSYSKGSEIYNKEDLAKYIEYYQKLTKEYFSFFEFNFREPNEYKNWPEFTNHVNSQGYSIRFQNISEAYINQLVDEGKLYLFQIYNKDFSPYSTGKPNLHTMYWRMLFDEENLRDVVYKLNGKAEVFYRKASITNDQNTIHRAGETLPNKNPDNTKRHSQFDYDIIKDRRYTVDKFQFHVPITMNFKATGNGNINQDVLDFLKKNPEVNIIGLDRGERHLIYLSLINQRGEMLHQESLNVVQNTHQKVDYHHLLDQREVKNDMSRKNWGTIETIKELKEGYVSQVVHKVVTMMLEHNAIVVMEDLNFGFKRRRQKVEKQVYQKFEKMLIDKLNYLVLKDREANAPAGVLRALQLANKFESFSKLGKQSGFIFYMPAANTSKIDPATGFVNMLFTKYESVPKAQDFFSRFDKVCYRADKGYFEFHFDYGKFGNRAEGTRTHWVACTHGHERYRYNPQSKQSEVVNVSTELKKLFERHGVKYSDGLNLIPAIVAMDDKSFFSTLLHLLGLTLTLRHAKSGTDIDFILSPVANEKGEFFDSRKAGKAMPADADANGAYHVALKGLWALRTIQGHNDEWKKLKLALSNKEWLDFVQTKL